MTASTVTIFKAQNKRPKLIFVFSGKTQNSKIEKKIIHLKLHARMLTYPRSNIYIYVG